MAGNERRVRYWRANLRILVILLSIWFGVSFGLGILLVEPLNRIHIGGFPLGFWFAQQGSIYVLIDSSPAIREGYSPKSRRTSIRSPLRGSNQNSAPSESLVGFRNLF